LPFAAQVFCGIVVMDLAVSAEHRFIHRFAWPFHAIHHSAEEVTWITALSVHPANVFTIALFNSSIGWVLGFSGEAWVLGLMLMSFLSILEHANPDWNWWGPLRHLVVSPHFHKWHHAQREEAVDKHFGLGFSFIAVILGRTTTRIPKSPRASGYIIVRENHRSRTDSSRCSGIPSDVVLPPCADGGLSETMPSEMQLESSAFRNTEIPVHQIMIDFQKLHAEILEIETATVWQSQKPITREKYAAASCP
jgi:hypothetical protein